MDSMVKNTVRNRSLGQIEQIWKTGFFGPENSISLNRGGVKMAKIELKKLISTPKKLLLSFLAAKMDSTVKNTPRNRLWVILSKAGEIEIFEP